MPTAFLQTVKRIVFLLIIFLPYFGNAQVYQVPADSLDSVSMLTYESPFYRMSNSLGVFPEIQFIKSPIISLSASFSHYTGGEGGAKASGVNIGFDIAPFQIFYGPKVSLWTAAFAYFIGGNISINTMYYFQGDRSGWYLRPEIGIGLPLIHLKYGYGFLLSGDEINGFPKHSLTLGGHVPIFKLKKRKSRRFAS